MSSGANGARGGPRHMCPGNCGRLVAADVFACRICWRRMPGTLRVAITRAWGRRNTVGAADEAAHAHRAAMLDACAWFNANPEATT